MLFSATKITFFSEIEVLVVLHCYDIVEWMIQTVFQSFLYRLTIIIVFCSRLSVSLCTE